MMAGWISIPMYLCYIWVGSKSGSEEGKGDPEIDNEYQGPVSGA
jgi:hypothetical protein